jgi:hypothetical protein
MKTVIMYGIVGGTIGTVAAVLALIVGANLSESANNEKALQAMRSSELAVQTRAEEQRRTDDAIETARQEKAKRYWAAKDAETLSYAEASKPQWQKDSETLKASYGWTQYKACKLYCARNADWHGALGRCQEACTVELKSTDPTAYRIFTK